MNIVTGAVCYMECSALMQEGMVQICNKVVDVYEAVQSRASGRGARARK